MEEMLIKIEAKKFVKISTVVIGGVRVLTAASECELY